MTSFLARTLPADRQFERIYRKHLGDVYRYALVVLRNPADAEDATQTTFMNAYRAMRGGERPQAPKNWLIAIAHNVCRQKFRQAQRRPQEVALFDDAAELAVNETEERHSADDIQRALGHLAFNQRAALVMRELEGRSYAEIAEIMGLSTSAVETLIFRSRRALREQLEGTLTCAEAELLLSKQADGELSRAERGQLRAHLRECEVCAGAARSQRASRGAMKALFGAIPIPGSLTGLFGGSTAGVAIATKAAAIVVGGAVVGGAGFEGAKQAHVFAAKPKPNLVSAQRNQVRAVSAPKRAVPASPRANQVHGSATAQAHRAVPHVNPAGFTVPKGHTHLKVVTNVKITKGFVVPKGSTHVKVVSHLKVVPPKHVKKKAHPVPAKPAQALARPVHDPRPATGSPVTADTTHQSQSADAHKK